MQVSKHMQSGRNGESSFNLLLLYLLLRDVRIAVHHKNILGKNGPRNL